MIAKLRIYIATLFATACIVALVSAFPPLTNGGGGGSPDVDPAAFRALVQAERDYCRQQPEALDCGCFAHKSGAIQAQSEPRFAGAKYVDKKELARGQAARSC